jgi:hypothetical protein
MVLILEDVSSRASCLGVAYNLGSSLFGGTAPLVASTLTAATGGPRGAGVYLAIVTWLSVSAIAVADRMHRRRTAGASLLLPGGDQHAGGVTHPRASDASSSAGRAGEARTVPASGAA